MPYVEAAREIILLALLITVVYTDLAQGKAYDWCTLPAMGIGLILATVLGGVRSGEANLVASLLGIAVAGGLFGLFYFFGGFSAGDVKMAAAIGALKGWRFALEAILYAALIGGVMALGVLIWKGQLLRGLRDTARAAVRLRRSERVLEQDSPARLTIPYGVAIALGTMWVWFARYAL
ncbi:MAG: A24 family peptidase [Planctomycetota bacterium]